MCRFPNLGSDIMDILHELWMHCICGFEADKTAQLVRVMNKTGRSFNSEESSYRSLVANGVSEAVAARAGDISFFDEARSILDYCNENNIRIITRMSENYPSYLGYIHLPPRLIFAKGLEVDMNTRISVAVVGCRKPTELGRSSAERIGAGLAKEGLITVSGMAEGIDTSAHWGAIRAGGLTVAVLAGGVDVVYPMSNRKLYDEITEHGMIISERPPTVRGKEYFYEQRNRIVTGLSRGTVVVEGTSKSGTSMTARLALEENRDIFAVPGNPMNRQSQLPNTLINDGAVIVSDFDVPAKFYRENNPEFFGNNADKTPKKSAEPMTAESTPIEDIKQLKDEERILNYISERGGVATNDEIAAACGIPQSKLNGKLTMMSLKGMLRQESGNRYVIR